MLFVLLQKQLNLPRYVKNIFFQIFSKTGIKNLGVYDKIP